MRLFLGIDGGGTGSRALLGDDERVLARAEGGPANPRSLGVEEAWRTLTDLAQRALQQASLPQDLKALHVCMGLAGVGQEEDRKRFLAVPHPFSSLRLETDVHVALVGALGQEEGALLAAGTGSIIYAVDAFSRRYRAGGWGLSVGDEGSGAWLGREAVRLALQAHDGRGERTVLLERLLEAWGPSVDALMERVRLAGPADFGSLAPLVFAAAREDGAAQTLITQAVTELVRLLEAIDRRYPSGPVPFSMTGSITKLLLGKVLKGAPERFQAGYREARAAPDEGALMLARNAAFNTP